MCEAPATPGSVFRRHDLVCMEWCMPLYDVVAGGTVRVTYLPLQVCGTKSGVSLVRVVRSKALLSSPCSSSIYLPIP